MEEEEEECGLSKKLWVAAQISWKSYMWGCSERTDSRRLVREAPPETEDLQESLLKLDVEAVLGIAKLPEPVEYEGLDEESRWGFLDFLDEKDDLGVADDGGLVG